MKKFILGFLSCVMLMYALPALAYVEQKIEAYFGEYTIIVNGNTVDLEDSKIIVKDGTTYLPVRKTANILGYDVTYKADSRTIVLESAVVEVVDEINKNEKSLEYVENIQLDIANISGRELVDLLYEKYPESEIYLSVDGELFIGENRYYIPKTDNGYDASELIEHGVLLDIY